MILARVMAKILGQSLRSHEKVAKRPPLVSMAWGNQIPGQLGQVQGGFHALPTGQVVAASDEGIGPIADPRCCYHLLENASCLELYGNDG